MFYSILADLVVVIHLAFVIFVVAGAVSVIWWRLLVWLHLPALFWAVWIEFSGGICPLTPLENWLRLRGGQGGYQIGFVEQYLLPVLYPVGLTRSSQILLGILVIAINAAVYAVVIVISRPLKRDQEEKQ
ncbi:MAG: DUF2784 domain-containing protein [Desulfobacterales bacterium]|nr:MAG: DUF2784 domain-containing protein [Desulfobacterales bacterium]